jgi:F420-non-reducing hydrogenase iron-sulfur subunit
MAPNDQSKQPKILILATLSGGYAGADTTGQAHIDYPANTYILPVMSPVMFPPQFFVRAFERGIDGIIIMYSGTDSPYKVEADVTAKLISRSYGLMKERGLDIRRLRLAAICTVCVKPFLKEVNQMNELLKGLGTVKDELATRAVQEPTHG